MKSFTVGVVVSQLRSKCLLGIRRSTLALIICGPNNFTLGVFANLGLD